MPPKRPDPIAHPGLSGNGAPPPPPAQPANNGGTSSGCIPAPSTPKISAASMTSSAAAAVIASRSTPLSAKKPPPPIGLVNEAAAPAPVAVSASKPAAAPPTSTGARNRGAAASTSAAAGDNGAAAVQPVPVLKQASAGPPPPLTGVASSNSAASPHSISAEERQRRCLPQALSVADRKRVLFVMCLLKIITSYDSGAYGAVLGIDDGIAQDLQLSVVDEGALGSAPFVGNTIGCAVAGVLFSRFEAKPMLMLGMGLHFVSTILFAMSPTFIVALLSRTIIGFTLSFVVVYSVVWTDVFAPPEKATTWLAMMNAGVPLGMLLGFIMGGYMTPELELSWRLTFLFKAVILLPVLWTLHRSPPDHVNDPGATDTHRKRKHEAQIAAAAGTTVPRGPTVFQSVARNASVLLRNELFVCAVLGLVVLYFVVTAMQVFITSYLRGPPFYASMTTIVFGFGAASVTAPVFGVVAGGVILDRLGGYQTNLRRAAIFGATCGTLAAWFGLLACYMTTVPTFIAALWCMLFVGAANVPVGTGILMAAVAPSMRPTASSYAAVAFNVFGYFLGPIFCGYMADITGSLQQAFHIVLMMSGLGCIPLGLTVIFAANHEQPSDDAPHEGHDPTLVGTPTVLDEHMSQLVVEGSFVVSVPTTPQRTPQRTPLPVPLDHPGSPFEGRRPATPQASLSFAAGSRGNSDARPT